MSVFNKKISKISDFQNVAVAPSDSNIVELKCESIVCLKQVRSMESEGFFNDSLMDLGESMKNNGQIEPVIVRKNPTKKNSFIMVAGERRLKAAQLLGLPLKAIILELDEEAARRIQIAENIHRQNLDQKEIAAAVSHDKKKMGTLEKVAEAWNKSINWVSQMVKLDEALAKSDSITAELIKKNITADVTVITDMDKLEKIDMNAAMEVLDRLSADPEKNVRKVVKDILKKAKKKKEDSFEAAETDSSSKNAALPSKRVEISCDTLDKLLKMASAAISIVAVCIKCSKDHINTITISVQNDPNSKSAQDLVFKSDDYPLAQAFTLLFKKMPADKLAQNFASHIYFKH